MKLALGLGKGKTHRDQRYDLKARVEMREAQREVARINAVKAVTAWLPSASSRKPFSAPAIP